MPQFCDVALPVPLAATFTYRLHDAMPVIGGRVLVPFRSTRLAGVVTALHNTAPEVKTKEVLQVLDSEPVLDDSLIELGKWLATYYFAPIGEVFRAMLPLSAEVKRRWGYRLSARGRNVLYESSIRGSSLRAKRSMGEQMAEYEVLNYLATSASAPEGTLRSGIGATRELLRGMVRKRWIVREDISSVRNAERAVKVAILSKTPEVSARLNHNQQRIIRFLSDAGGRQPVSALDPLAVPRTTLQTLVRRGLVGIELEPTKFSISNVKLSNRSPAAFELNDDQKKALEEINHRIANRKFSVSLLHGVTSSGKTAIYLAAMGSVLQQGRSAIMLVPEIGLTPAAAANLQDIFGEQVAILHSALSADERAEQWHRVQRGRANIIVGTRSAVFAPVKDLALIVVDEEHDSSYKQEETPRYHGRDVAVMRGKLSDAAVVLGSATPSLESYYHASSGKYKLIELRHRVEQRSLPEVEIVDMRQEFRETGEEHLFSRKLLGEIGARLDKKQQAIVLLNRRGYAAVVFCRACGETVQCRDCAIAMTHHKGGRWMAGHVVPGQRLECHYCGYRATVPELCPKCHSQHLYFLGSGSEKLEEKLRAAFPTARIGRLDRDTVRGRHDFERVLNQLHAGELDLLVGTQMVAKGHDIHGVTLVGVVGADFALGFPDFRAAERTFQLLTQVAGRAGRGNSPGKVILQTYFPEHYAIQYAAAHDFSGFYLKELRYRSWMHYPPFSAIANVLVRSDRLDQSLKFSAILGRWFEKTRPEGVRVLGPAAAPISRLKRDYRYHFVLKSRSRKQLHATLRRMLEDVFEQKVPRTNLVIDVDPMSLL